jgi:hypothetical protein
VGSMGDEGPFAATIAQERAKIHRREANQAPPQAARAPGG